MKKLLLCLGISLSLFSSLSLATDSKAIVLMYHTIGSRSTDMNTTPEHFKEQMEYLYNNNYNVISSIDLVNDIKNKKEIPPKTIVLTFDDGWANQTNAMEEMSKYKYPATFSLVTEYQKTKNKTYLQEKDFIKYKEQPYTYVNHSRTHFIKDFLKNPAEDVRVSKRDMIEDTGVFTPIYVYPYGLRNKSLVEELKKNGYIAAFGVYGEPVNIKKADIFDINRFQINDTIDIEKFSKILKRAS